MMVTFIAKRIIKACEESEAQGKAKYNAYFVNTHMYAVYKDDVDTILRTDGYEWVIAE